MAKYDKRDPTRAEMLLTRAGHHLLYLRRKSRPPVYEERPFWEALETIWQAKREVKVEIRAKSVESFRKWKERRAL